MNQYETIFIINSELDEESNKAVIEKFKSLIEANGTVDSVDEWGVRRLAYPINDKTDGFYVLVNFQAPPEFPSELERNYKISDDILKFLTIRKGE